MISPCEKSTNTVMEGHRQQCAVVAVGVSCLSQRGEGYSYLHTYVR